MARRILRSRLVVAALGAGLCAASVAAAEMQVAVPVESACRPVAQRTGDVGCWILTDAAVGVLPQTPIFWHLDVFPTRAAAEAARGPAGTVVESLGQVWLFTIAPDGFMPAAGGRMARIGPLPVQAGTAYSAMYMEAISTPGMTSATHTHSGPEAWYTLAGAMCLETPQGATIGEAGSPPVIIPGGPPMHLTSVGPIERRALVLVLHDSAQPPITIERAWTPKGLCRGK